MKVVWPMFRELELCIGECMPEWPLNLPDNTSSFNKNICGLASGMPKKTAHWAWEVIISGIVAIKQLKETEGVKPKSGENLPFSPLISGLFYFQHLLQTFPVQDITDEERAKFTETGACFVKTHFINNFLKLEYVIGEQGYTPFIIIKSN